MRPEGETRRQEQKASSHLSSHVLCMAMVLVPPMKISDTYSSIARLLPSQVHSNIIIMYITLYISYNVFLDRHEDLRHVLVHRPLAAIANIITYYIVILL